jgi:hypothetical protein
MQQQQHGSTAAAASVVCRTVAASDFSMNFFTLGVFSQRSPEIKSRKLLKKFQNI